MGQTVKASPERAGRHAQVSSDIFERASVNISAEGFLPVGLRLFTSPETSTDQTFVTLSAESSAVFLDK